ncbi:hypothetical protein ACWEKT_25390 [Nocardia takedensis]
MGEVFLADAAEVAGLGKIVGEIGTDSASAATFIGKHGMPAEWLDGPIISDLLSPVRAAATATQQRMSSIGATTTAGGTDLNKAAWMYHDKDRHTYEQLNKHTFSGPVAADSPVPTDVENVGTTEDYIAPAGYTKAKEFKLEEPTANKEDTIALIYEIAPELGKVNETIKSITRIAGNEIDPLGKCLEPIPGNWSEVRRIGESYKAAGNGMEACGDNLEAAVKRVDQHWNGKAAVAFNDWATKQIAAMKWEGPVGRIISDCLGVVADEIRTAVKTILTKLWDILNDQIDLSSVKGVFKTIFKSIPIVKTVELVNLGRKIYNIATTAIDLVTKIQQLVDQVKRLLEYVKDPVGQLKQNAQQKLEEVISPFTDKLEKASRATAVATDVAKIAQVDDTLNRPDQGYDVGAGTTPWDDAS